jgi:hypothetical protein
MLSRAACSGRAHAGPGQWADARASFAFLRDTCQVSRAPCQVSRAGARATITYRTCARIPDDAVALRVGATRAKICASQA